MARLRVGVVGAGYIAGRHVTALSSFDDVAVVGVADPDRDRAGALAARCEARPYGGFEELLDREAIDAVYLCVPPFAHGPPEQAAIERGLPFFVEKPLALDVGVAERIAGAVVRAGLVTATGYHWRYLDVVERAAEALDGRPPLLALGYWLDTTPGAPWWSRASQSGGQMVEQTTHIFDVARVLVGEPRTVRAEGCRVERPAFPDADVLSASTATVRFESGALGSFTSTCLLRGPHRVGLHLFGEGFAVEVSEFSLLVDDERGRRSYESSVDPFALEDRDFLDAVAGGPDRVRAPYAEALRTHRVAAAAARAAADGTVVDLAVPGAR